jgi:hypothetical protein
MVGESRTRGGFSMDLAFEGAGFREVLHASSSRPRLNKGKGKGREEGRGWESRVISYLLCISGDLRRGENFRAPSVLEFGQSR